MAVLLLAGLVGVVLVAYLAERLLKVRGRIRRRRVMSVRLGAVAFRVDEQQEQHAAREQASAELTSFLPAIQQPPLTVPGGSGREVVPPPESREHTGHAARPGACGPRAARPAAHPAGHPAAHPDSAARRTAARSGEHPVRSGEHPVRH